SANSRIGRRLCFREENLQIIEKVARVHDELGALLDQTIRSLRTRCIDVTRHRVDGTALLKRLRDGDKRAAIQTCFHDENAVAPTADDSVAHWKGLAVGFYLHGELRNDRTVAIANFLRKSGILRRIKFRQTRTDHSNRATFRREGAL